MRRFLSERKIDLGAATLLAFAALATSWSGYQSTIWNGEQSRAGVRAAALRGCAARAATRGGQERTVDVITFIGWVSATANSNPRLARFYETRMRPEFAPAFKAWLGTRQPDSLAAAAVPFSRPEYLLASDVEMARCDEEATIAAEAMQHANRVSDNYMLATVIFAIVLFFAGGVRDARSRDLQLTMLVIAVAACAAGLAHVMRLPRA